MKIAISAESTIDIPVEMQKEFNIHTIPFTVLLGEKVGLDGDITPPEIFDYVAKNNILPKTSAINEYQYFEYFENLLKEYDYVIHFSLSSDLSSAYKNACSVAENLKNVTIIDSKTLSTGIALLVLNACDLRDQGKSVEEILESTRARLPYAQASFVVNTLDYLHKGGRCSGLTRLMALVFRIKPQIVVADGKMKSTNKFTGKNESVVDKYAKAVFAEFKNPDLTRVFVTHSYADQSMVDVAVKACKERGFKQIYVTTAGATITSHCGPKTLGILFINDNK
jgi:DegV family protein with EDD domain